MLGQAKRLKVAKPLFFDPEDGVVSAPHGLCTPRLGILGAVLHVRKVRAQQVEGVVFSVCEAEHGFCGLGAEIAE